MFPHLSVKSIFSQVFAIVTEQLQPKYDKVNVLVNIQNTSQYLWFLVSDTRIWFLLLQATSQG